jgi:hypothetical protein
MDGKDFYVWSLRRTPGTSAAYVGSGTTGAKFHLDNLTHSRSQLHSDRQLRRDLEPFADKYARNGEVFECDGNDIASSSQRRARDAFTGKPHVIIANTVPGEAFRTWKAITPRTLNARAEEARRLAGAPRDCSHA